MAVEGSWLSHSCSGFSGSFRNDVTPTLSFQRRMKVLVEMSTYGYYKWKFFRLCRYRKHIIQFRISSIDLPNVYIRFWVRFSIIRVRLCNDHMVRFWDIRQTGLGWRLWHVFWWVSKWRWTGNRWNSVLIQWLNQGWIRINNRSFFLTFD